MEKKKRDRGANYTIEEKTLLADLVAKYKDIVDDKRTKGIINEKKREAWKAITRKYNSNCTTGARETEQLKALYDNMKQKSRKIVGDSNVQAPITTDCVAKMLNVIIQDQVLPVPNPFDSAAAYYKETDHLKQLEDHDCSTMASTSSVSEQETQDDDTGTDKDQYHLNGTTNKVLTPAQDRDGQKKQVHKKITKDDSAENGMLCKEQSLESILLPNHSPETLKRLYFKKKCRNADLERRKLALEILYLKQEHNLKMDILKNELNILKQKDNKDSG